MARSFIEAHISSHHQRRLLHSLLDHFPEGENSPYVDIPLLVYGAITGDEEKAIPLAVLGKFFFLGMDIIDDISDGDAKDHWPGHSLSELELGSSLFLSALPQNLIAELETSAEIRIKIQRRFASGLLEAAAGQQMELGMTGQMEINPQEVEESVRGKSSGIGTLASIAALLGGATEDQVNSYETMGRNLGTAAQLATDFYDLFQAPVSRDLRNGTRTLPITLALQKCTEAENKILFGPHEAARTLLISKGIGRLTAFIIELYCERAKKSLEAVDPKKSYQKRLASYINTISLFKKEGESDELSRCRKANRQMAERSELQGGLPKRPGRDDSKVRRQAEQRRVGDAPKGRLEPV